MTMNIGPSLLLQLMRKVLYKVKVFWFARKGISLSSMLLSHLLVDLGKDPTETGQHVTERI